MTVRIWLLRIAWITLPLTAGAAADDFIATFDDAPRVVAAVFLVGSWGAGVVALLAPRPIGLTFLRTMAPAYLVLAVIAPMTRSTELPRPETSGLADWGAFAACLVVAVLMALPDIGRAAANGIAYGDEQRFPLRVPPALFLGPLPLARGIVVAATAAGPLLLAEGEVVLGIAGLIVGAPLVAFSARALHALSRRWLVLVPAGVVVVDPMTLAEPVLFIRRHVRALRAVDSPASTSSADEVLDLRLGAAFGNVLIDLDEAAEMVRTNRGKRGGVATHTAHLMVAVGERTKFLDAAAARRVRT